MSPRRKTASGHRLRAWAVGMAECTPTLPYGTDPWLQLSTVDPGDDGVIGIAETYGGDQPAKALEAIRGQVVGVRIEHVVVFDRLTELAIT